MFKESTVALSPLLWFSLFSLLLYVSHPPACPTPSLCNSMCYSNMAGGRRELNSCLCGFVSSRYMFGKGAKRKLDEDEEGWKAKQGLSKVSYTLQRQTIFNISLMKLYSQRPLGEPSLERRVLINNMLRRIQDELKQEGSLRPLLLPTMGAKPEAPGVLLAEARCGELRPMDPLPTLPPGSLVDSSCPSSPPSSASPSGFLSDLALDDVLFADIDTSMYDFDPCMTTGTVGVTAGGSLTKLSPVVTTDDLLKSLASPYSSSAPQVSANQPFKIDLTELDHIMEVLVGS
uniref:SERTA domain containing 2b n=1 Tax=Lates calcarifer TaxID=8187 RepID=A0A4W6BY53_LATCA